MLEIEYTTTTPETANATMDFMLNRPLLAAMFLFMKISCWILCLVFAIAFYYKALRPQDYATIGMVFVWLMFYKQINRWVIKSTLKRRKFDDLKCVLRMDDKSVFYRIQQYTPQHIEWKKLRYVLKNNEGYIIPLTGITNAGKFLWLPLRSLNGEQEKTFLDFVQKFKLKVKAPK